MWTLSLSTTSPSPSSSGCSKPTWPISRRGSAALTWPCALAQGQAAHRRTLAIAWAAEPCAADLHRPSRKPRRQRLFPSPVDQAAILTLDGVGEWSTATFGIGEGNRIRLIDHISFPHSWASCIRPSHITVASRSTAVNTMMGLVLTAVQSTGFDPRTVGGPEAYGSFWLEMDYSTIARG